MPFLLDANIYIEASDKYYSHSSVPAFWDALEVAAGAGNARSIDAIYQEITKADNQLKAWVAANAGPPMFLDESALQIQTNVRSIATWVQNQPYGAEHAAKFLSGADPWLIAAAMAWDDTVVTHEQFISDPNTKKVKIPNVCAEFAVPYCDTFSMLRGLGVVFR